MIRASQRTLIAACLLISGCSADDGNNVSIPAVPVKGTITVAGKPVPAGIVVLEPVLEGGSDFQASGEIKDGAFELMSRSDVPGAVPGKYKVKLESDAVKLKPSRGEALSVEVKSGEDLTIALP